ncbi:MAG: hypothetical protein ACXW1U_17150 [Methylobacter sp.]
MFNEVKANHMPNMAVKGTRRSDAVLKVCRKFMVGGFAERPSAARPLPLRYVLKEGV